MYRQLQQTSIDYKFEMTQNIGRSATTITRSTAIASDSHTTSRISDDKTKYKIALKLSNKIANSTVINLTNIREWRGVQGLSVCGHRIRCYYTVQALNTLKTTQGHIIVGNTNKTTNIIYNKHVYIKIKDALRMRYMILFFVKPTTHNHHHYHYCLVVGR